jgi:integrase
MRGSLKRRYAGSWSVIIDLGYEQDPATGKKRRRQKWITVRGTKKQAQDKLTDLLHDLNRDQWVEPSKLTLGEWLLDWLDKAIKPPAKRLGTYEAYSRIIEKHIRPSFLGPVPLQELKPADLKRYYTELGLSASTQAIHHAILHSALEGGGTGGAGVSERSCPSGRQAQGSVRDG